MVDEMRKDIEKQDTQLDRIELRIQEIATVLLGVPDSDDKGLVGKVNESCEKQEKLSRNFWILVSTLVGSGVIGGSIWGVFN